MSRIFNEQILLSACNECDGFGFLKNENGEIIQKDDKDQRCKCYYANKFLEANIGFEYWNISLENFQGEEEDLIQITKYFDKIDLMKSQGRGFYIYGPDYGTGKALDNNTDVLTPDGWKKISDLIIGDFIIGQNGKPTKVSGIYPQGLKEAFKITFNDDTSVICCDEHLWKVRYGIHDFQILPLKEIRKNYLNTQGYGNYSIPLVEAMDFTCKDDDLPLHPYLMGLLLGDGGCSGQNVNFTTSDFEIIDIIKNILPENTEIIKYNKYGYRFKKKINGNSKNQITKILQQLNLMGKMSFEKYIPEIYKFASRLNRISLLQGLMDTDGTISKYQIEFSTTSEQLANDVKFLVQSLGGISTIRNRYTFYTYKGQKKNGRKSYRVSVKLPQGINPFRLKRKSEKVKPIYEKYPPNRKIEKIENIPAREMTCIKVEDDGLFVIQNFIVTHNTTIATLYLKYILVNTNYSCLLVPFSDLVILNTKLINGSFDKTIDEKINAIKNVDFLLLDDLAKEYDNQKDNGRATLNSVLRYRDLWNKPTIYTANVPIDDVKSLYGGSNYSIIYGRSILINIINTNDFRRDRKRIQKRNEKE